MAESTNSYGSDSGVAKLVGDIVLARTFGTTTIPTLIQVEQIIDGVAAELNVAFQSVGIAVPISTGSDPIVHQYLVHVNDQGAAAQVLGTIPGNAFRPGQEEVGSNRIEMYQASYLRALEAIKNNEVRATRSRRRTQVAFAGSQEDSNNRRKKPMFTREDDYNPRSSRGLTE